MLQWRFIDRVAARIDEAALREAQAAKDAVRAYELVYAALGRVRLQHVSIAIPAEAARSGRARSTAACSASRSGPCCRSSIPARFIWYRAGGDLELHLKLIDEPPPDRPHFCLVVDELEGLRAPARGGGRRDARRDAELVGRPRFICRDPFGNLIEFARIEP